LGIRQHVLVEDQPPHENGGVGIQNAGGNFGRWLTDYSLDKTKPRRRKMPGFLYAPEQRQQPIFAAREEFCSRIRRIGTNQTARQDTPRRQDRQAGNVGCPVTAFHCIMLLDGPIDVRPFIRALTGARPRDRRVIMIRSLLNSSA